jgi:bifunctional non-homologous end joining protein LigD
MTKTKATFIEPMLLLRTEKLPQAADWLYEIKLDGYRVVAIKSGDKVQLRSRNNNDFTERYAPIASALRAMPDDTVLDGEMAALDEEGRPSFNLLQNYASSNAPLVFFVFDVLILKGRSVMAAPLSERRALLEKQVLPKLGEPIRYSPELKASLPDLIESAKSAGLEGLVAKRRNSRYEPGLRSGAWQKMRVNRGQEFVIGGYTPSDRNFDAMIFGYYNGGKLQYVARTRNGFTPSSREHLFKKLKPLEVKECPFANLPEARSGRWGAGLTAAKMKDCRWLKPVLVGQFEFTEWTPDNHLRHSRFIALRDDKKPKEVRREG